MREHLVFVSTLVLLLGGMILLNACHTTAGVGEDLSGTGHAMTHSAVKHTPN